MDRDKLNKELNRGRVPVIVYFAIVALIIYGLSSVEPVKPLSGDALIVLKILIVLLAICLVHLGVNVTRKYKFHDDGLTVIWLGIFRHKFDWDKIPHGGVVISVGFNTSHTPFILCSKHEWIKTVNAPLFFFLFPFSVFNFPYTPEIYEELERVCANLEYMEDRDLVMAKYRQLSKW